MAFDVRQTLRRLREDRLIRGLLKQSGWLWAGRFATAAAGLGALGLMYRGLSTEQVGVLVLIQAYIVVTENLMSFMSWKVLIKYGADARAAGDANLFLGLVKFSTALDAGACVVAALAAFGGSWIFAWNMDWGSYERGWIMASSLVLLFKLNGCPTAVLRMFERYRLIAGQEFLGAALRLALVIVAYARGAGLGAYIAAWIAADVAASLLLLALGWRELARQGCLAAQATGLRDTIGRFPGIWNFVWISNINTTSVQVLMQLDIFVVTGFLGEAGAASYKVVKSFGGILNQMATPLRQVIYPYMTELGARGDGAGLRQLTRRMTGLFAGAGATLTLGFALLGYPALLLCFSSDYSGLFLPALIFFAGEAFRLSSRAVAPLLMARERHRALFVINQVTTVAFLGALAAGTPAWSLPGAALANVIAAVLFIALSYRYVAKNQEALYPVAPAAA